MVSLKFRQALLVARSRGIKQYEIARQATVHPTVLSAIVHSAIPVKLGDQRVVRIGTVLGLAAPDCFENESQIGAQDTQAASGRLS
jgi:hypothetical protein